MSNPTCHRCKIEMNPRMALVPTMVAHDDFGDDAGQPGTTISPGGSGKMVDCWKCPLCGHSIRKA